jgi:hypothetical protein
MNVPVFLLIFSLALLCSLWWPHQGPAQSRAAAQVRTRLQRLLKPRSPDDCPACRLGSTASSGEGPAPADVASLARGQKPAWSTQASQHPGVRLSQPTVPVLREYRCSDPRGFSGMANMGRLRGSRRSVVRRAAPPSVLDVIPPCTG